MKAKLIFNLPEDETEFKEAINASKYSSLVFHLRHNLYRNLCKHQNKSEEYEKGVRDAMDSLLEYLDDE